MNPKWKCPTCGTAPELLEAAEQAVADWEADDRTDDQLEETIVKLKAAILRMDSGKCDKPTHGACFHTEGKCYLCVEMA